MKKKSLIIISNNNLGPVQSGGDTIYLAFIKYWTKKLDITLWGSQESLNLLRKNKLKTNFIQSDSINTRYQPTVLNLLWHSLRRTIKGLISFTKNHRLFKNFDYCYTTSDFLPDFIFGLLYKLLNSHGQWLCGYYLVAPSPKSPVTPYKNQTTKNYFYYLIQKITLRLTNRYADYILITSKPDKIHFPNKKVIVVQGGVDLTASEKYLKSKYVKPVSKRQFDAVFLGRLHPQKGVLELINIWEIVVDKIPGAQLALVGDGQLKKNIKEKILKSKLTKNITLFGFKIGKAKQNIFKNSKIVVHPAIYDSGGMAAAEAMAWGLPGVSFDLESLKTYYPEGMLKSPLNNYQHFAGNIIRLLKDKKLYNQISSEALKLIRNKWDWKKRSQNIYNLIFNDK
jgi:glycosyltransferase involved in cell wall biosynthesis